MGRVLLAGALVAACASIAHADPTRKVTIVTDPPGATVYLNDVEAGAVCQATPCSIDVPLGSPVLIVRLDKYAPLAEPLDVPRGRQPLQLNYKLSMAIGTLVIETASAKGASVRVDDEDKGKVPTRVEVSGNDSHHVVIAMNGKTLFDDLVNVGIGEEVDVTPKPGAGAPVDNSVVVVKDTPDETGGSGSGSGSGTIGAVGPAPASNRFLSISAMFDIGFRDFSYDKSMGFTPNIRNENEGGTLMAGGAIELWPFANASGLAGLSVFGRYERGVHGEQIVSGAGLTTFWESFEASLRYRMSLMDSFALSGSIGFAHDHFGFIGDPADIANAPDAAYGSIRLAIRASFPLGSLEPYAGLENRIVVDRGSFGARFQDASAGGYGAQAGVSLKAGSFALRAEATLLRFSWGFGGTPASPYYAAGGTDAIEMITTTAGYEY